MLVEVKTFIIWHLQEVGWYKDLAHDANADQLKMTIWKKKKAKENSEITLMARHQSGITRATAQIQEQIMRSDWYICNNHPMKIVLQYGVADGVVVRDE